MMLDQESRSFPLTISWPRIEIADVDIRLPATALGLVSPKLAALSLTGEVQLQIASFSVGRDAMLGGAMLLWRSAGSALSPVSPLGDYEMRFEGEGPVIRTTLHTLHGPLQLDGQGSWADGRNLGFLVTARIPPEFQEQLWPFLRLIAVERGDGSFELQIK
jgi:general secretion pathway protein N